MSRRVLGWTIPLLLVTLAVYGPVRRHPFLDLDDPLYVAANPVVREGLTSGGLRWAFTTSSGSNWHPLTWISHMADVSAFGMDPGSHHLVNLAFHLVNVLLLFQLLVGMTGQTGRSALAAALFAVHPLHVESVAWIAERKDLLSTCLGLLAAMAYLRHRRRPSPGRYLAVALLFTAALMAKPMMVTLPLLLLLLDYWPLGRLVGGGAGGAGYPTPVAEKAPLLLLSALSSWVTLTVQRAGGAVETLEALPLSVRAANALHSYAAYLGRALWPADLAIFYPHPGHAPPAPRTALAALALLGIALLSWRWRRRFPQVAMGFAIYLGTLVPVIGLVQVGAQAMADRYTYLPLTGIFLLVAWSVPRPEGRRRLLVPAAAVLAVALLALAARAQLGHWGDVPGLWRHAIRVTRGNWMAHNNLGVSLDAAGRTAEALAHYQQAVALRPGYREAHYNLGSVLDRLGRTEEALEAYRRAVAISPGYAKAHYNLGILLAREGREGEAEEAYRRAMGADPSFPRAHTNLGILLLGRGDREGALDLFQRVVRLEPGNPLARLNLGLVLADLGRFGEARLAYGEALRLNPSLREAKDALGRLPAGRE